MKRDSAGLPTMKLLRRLFRLFTSPLAEWQQIDREDVSLRHLYVGWLLPLVLLVWLGLVSGQHLYDDAPVVHHPLRLTKLLVLLGGGGLAFFVQFTLLALVAQLCAPQFGGTRHLRKAFAVVGYAMAGLLVAAALQPLLMPLFPLLMVLGGSWSVYLLLGGMPALLKVSPRGGRILSGIVVVLFLLTNMLLRPLAHRAWEGMVPPETEPAIVGAEGPALRQGDGRVLVSIEKVQQADRNLDEAAREAGSASARNDSARVRPARMSSVMANPADRNLAVAARGGGRARARHDSLAAAQAARDAATALAATVSGGQERVPLTPAQLSNWFPSEILGMKLQSLQIEPWGGMSSRAVMAHGIYGRRGSTELDLRLIDPASAGALLAQSAASGAQGHKESETTATIESSYREGARSVSELRWKDSSRIEIGYVLANGVRLTAQASGIDATALHGAIRQLPLGVLERNHMVPVESLPTVTRPSPAIVDAPPSHPVQSGTTPP